MEQPQNTITSNDILTSLAGILFFGPFIKSEHLFVQGYCRVWKLNLVLLILTFIAFVGAYFYPHLLLNRMIVLSAGAICVISAFSIFSCLNEVQLFAANETLQHEIPHKEMIIKSFLPVYNVKLWYQSTNFHTPYRWLKESILWRTFFSFVALVFGVQVGTFFLALIAIRLLLLLVNIDLIPNNLKKFLHHGFLVHPEESIGKVLSFTKKEEKAGEETQIQASMMNITLQYLTFIALLRLIRRNVVIDYQLIVPLLALLYLIARALLTYWNYRRLPPLPILNELWSLVLK